MRLWWFVRRLAPIGVILIAIITAVALMVQWTLVCTNHTLQHINNLCMNHMSGEVIGNLCESLCLKETVESLACHPSNRQEELAFSATWKGRRIIFKSPKSNDLLTQKLPQQQQQQDRKQQYPTDEEFLSLIRQLVYTKMNINISLETAKEISTIPVDNNYPVQSSDRLIEMDSAWFLLQDRDYLSTVLFSNKDIFPKRVGTCGYLYATEYVETIRGTSALFSLEDDDEEWERRVSLAASVQDLVGRLDDADLQLCDVQLRNFGLIENRLHYLSPGDIRLRHTFSKNLSCKIDHDCGHFDCKALCNITSGRCNMPIEGDNLQMVCEKIYLGWAADGRVIIPGLLVSTKTSSGLSAMLRRCADPGASPHGKSFRLALYNTLIRKS